MATSSSAKKIARLAQASKNRKGRRVRVQGGSFFPTVIFVVCVLGVALIAYARESQQRVSALDTATQTYYTAFGIYKCDSFIENLPATADLSDVTSVKPGAFIEAPGVVRWEPQVLSGERRAKLETIFELYGLKVSNDSIEFPSSLNNGEKITETDTKCGDKEASVQAVVWDSKISTPKISIADLGDVRLTGNGMAITLAFVAKDADVPQPITVSDLDPLITG